MNRDTAGEILRQINFTKTMRMRAIDKHEAKIANYDDKIAALEAELDTVSPN